MIDHGVGRILDALEREGLQEDTVVVFAPDHGDRTGQFQCVGKGLMYSHSVRIPMIVADPAGATGERCDRVVNGLDLFGTVLDRCGVDPGRATSSRSLVPLVRDPEGADWTDRTFVERGGEKRDGSRKTGEALAVDGDYKLYRYGDETYTHELYDRTERPHDATNRWDRRGYLDTCDRLLEVVSDLQARAAAGRPLVG